MALKSSNPTPRPYQLIISLWTSNEQSLTESIKASCFIA